MSLELHRGQTIMCTIAIVLNALLRHFVPIFKAPFIKCLVSDFRSGPDQYFIQFLNISISSNLLI